MPECDHRTLIGYFMIRLCNIARVLAQTVLLLTLSLIAACGNSARGTYENVNGFAVMELKAGNKVAVTIYNKEVPCASYTEERERVTLQCEDGPLAFIRTADGSLVSLALETRGMSLPFRGPAGTRFGAFRKTK